MESENSFCDLIIRKFNNYPIKKSRVKFLSADDLRARSGRVTLITGKSGSGKSCLLELLAGLRSSKLENGSSIRIEILDKNRLISEPLNTFCSDAPRLSYLPQQSVLRPHLTPEQTVTDWIRLITTEQRAEVQKNINELRPYIESSLFDEKERKEIFSSRISDLSGGERRRIEIMLALISPASIILLDEPATGLDIERRTVLYELLIRFARDYRRIILMVSHFTDREIKAEDCDLWKVSNGFVECQIKNDEKGKKLYKTPPAENPKDLIIRQGWIYFKQRIISLCSNRKEMLFSLTFPFVLMALIRFSIYPDDDPLLSNATQTIKIILFYCVASFWLGALQAAGFWTREHYWFHRECRQGASSVSYVGSFLLYLALIAVIQSLIGAGVIKWFSINHMVLLEWGKIGHDILVSFLYLWIWGTVASFNGAVTGLLLVTWYYLWTSRTTRAVPPDAVTSQLLVVLLTLICIVCAYPTLGNKPYYELDCILANNAQQETGYTSNYDRMAIAGQALKHASITNQPLIFISVAEFPWLSQLSFHALWFWGERAEWAYPTDRRKANPDYNRSKNNIRFVLLRDLLLINPLVLFVFCLSTLIMVYRVKQRVQ